MGGVGGRCNVVSLSSSAFKDGVSRAVESSTPTHPRDTCS